MRCIKLLSCLLALMMPLPCRADPVEEALADIAMGIREHLPRSNISPFTCMDKTCISTIDFVWFSTYFVVTMGADARPTAMAVVMAPSKYSNSTDVQEFFGAAFNAAAVAIVSLTAPDMAAGQRVAFAAKVVNESEQSVKYGDWKFSSRTTPLRFRVFDARHE